MFKKKHNISISDMYLYIRKTIYSMNSYLNIKNPNVICVKNKRVQ